MSVDALLNITLASSCDSADLAAAVSSTSPAIFQQVMGHEYGDCHGRHAAPSANSAQGRIQQLEQEIAKLQQQIARLADRADAGGDAPDSRGADPTQTFPGAMPGGSLQDQIASLQQEIASLQQELAQLNGQGAPGASGGAADGSTSASSLEGKIQHLQQEIAQLQQQLAQLQNLYGGDSDDAGSLAADPTQTSGGSLQDELAGLQQQLAQLESLSGTGGNASGSPGADPAQAMPATASSSSAQEQIANTQQTLEQQLLQLNGEGARGARATRADWGTGIAGFARAHQLLTIHRMQRHIARLASHHGGRALRHLQTELTALEQRLVRSSDQQGGSVPAQDAFLGSNIGFGG